MLGANRKQLLRHVYIPSATSWVFSSLHTSVGLASVGAVLGEYLGSASGVGYLILQAEGTLDVNTVFAGIVVLTIFALVLDGMVSVVEDRMLAWRPKAGVTEKILTKKGQFNTDTFYWCLSTIIVNRGLSPLRFLVSYYTLCKQY